MYFIGLFMIKSYFQLVSTYDEFLVSCIKLHNWLFAKATTIIAILRDYERVSAIRLSEYHGKHLPPYVFQLIYLPSFFFLPVIK